VAVVFTASLFEAHVVGRVAHEGRREDEGDKRDRGSTGDQDVPRCELRREPAGRSGGDRDSAVAHRLVQAERESPPLGTDEIDLHHHGHRPGEALVDPEEYVGGDDPGPARRHRDQQRHR
jgi:hypothetical protein